MAVLDILQFGNDILRQKSESVREFSVADEPVAKRTLIPVVKLKVFDRKRLFVRGEPADAFKHVVFPDLLKIIVPAAPSEGREETLPGVHFPSPQVRKKIHETGEVCS